MIFVYENEFVEFQMKSNTKTTFYFKSLLIFSNLSLSTAYSITKRSFENNGDEKNLNDFESISLHFIAFSFQTWNKTCHRVHS